MNQENIKRFYNEICKILGGTYSIVLEHTQEISENWIKYDEVKWELDDSVKNFVNYLKKEEKLSFEEKIIELYKYICINYVYDDNVLFFFRSNTNNSNNAKYEIADWYGRVIDERWKENRKKHNRRVCFEFARLYAKAINELAKSENNCEAFIVEEIERTHYVVGLVSDKYSIIFDVDDFDKIKDLTRLKLGLTIEGITILKDEEGKFKNIIDIFNKDKTKDLIEIEKIENNLRTKDVITYLNCIIDSLKSYNIDSQGFIEYIRAIIEKENIGIEKIWKEVKGGTEKRYSRCLIFNFDNKAYLLDSIEQKLLEIKKEELDKTVFIFKPEENEYKYYGG